VAVVGLINFLVVMVVLEVEVVEVELVETAFDVFAAVKFLEQK
jgi:hypothetical protein